jgi:mannose-6-phosphate isomerase
MRMNNELYLLKLCTNRVRRGYYGGKLIEMWQNKPEPKDGFLPEEWIASDVEAYQLGKEYISNEGLSSAELENGTSLSLKTLIDRRPSAMLGVEHIAEYGKSMALLIKILDSAERLGIQVHPDNSAAMKFFESNFGKAEAWYVIGGREINGEQPYILLGFKQGITRTIWEDLFLRQDRAAMENSLHKIPVKSGDVFLVEGGTPHALGPGCFVLEVQEPTDYTLSVERKIAAGLEKSEGIYHCGIGFEKMFDCFHYETYERDEVLRKWRVEPRLITKNDDYVELLLIDRMKTLYFGLNSIDVYKSAEIKNDHHFSVITVISGWGSLCSGDKRVVVKQGDSIFISACTTRIICRNGTGNKYMRLINCLPPASRQK